MARKTLSELGVRALKPRAVRYAYPGPELAGHYVRVQPSGVKSYCAVARTPAGKQIWTTIDSTDRMKIKTAREMARKIIRRVRDGLPAIEPRGETFGNAVEAWRTRHVRKNELRSANEIDRILDRYLLPAWRDREFVSLRRSDITALLDHIEDHHGARQADYCLSIVRSIMNWHAARRDDYNAPTVRGMRRQSPRAQARSHILSDDQLRALWMAAEKASAFGGVVQICLLTAQRRSKVIGMKWSEIEGDTWTLPLEAREKGNAGILVLPPLACAVIARQPRLGENPFVFAGRGNGPFNGLSKAKARLDQAAGVTGWTLHDLRRTARSLLSRAGVPSEHAERVMGHAIEGVEGTYDRHSYTAEKADALKRLAALIDSIVHKRSADVLPMQRKRKGK